MIQPDQIIVELGGGTGALTKIACAKMHPESTYIVFERDPELARFINQKCPKVKVLVADVEDFSEQMDKLNIQQLKVK